MQYLGVSFSDILNWQDDVALYDLHSIGTTVVNPTWAQPQFVNLGFGDFAIFDTAAGLRSTSPTIATGDPETDLALPPANYVNQLQNPSFENGTTSWSVNSGGTTQSGSPTAFDGTSSFYSGPVASGSAQQILNFATPAQAGTTDVSFGGRIRWLTVSPGDQAQIVLIFTSGLNGTGTVLSTTVVSASNTTDRWEQVGARVHVPANALSVTYRFQDSTSSASPDHSYLDAAFLFVLSATIATDIGAFGATLASSSEPDDEKIQLQSPDLYENLTYTQSHQILWSTFGNTGGVPVKIDLYHETVNGLQFLSNITPSTADTGSFSWTPQGTSGVNYGTYGLRIVVSLVGVPAITDISTEDFNVPENNTTYYVNDNSTTGDQYTTAPGNNRATGLIASAPPPLVTTVLRTYSLGSSNTIDVDTGSYQDFATIVLSGNPLVGTAAGVTIQGPTNGQPATISALGFTGPVVDVNNAAFVSLLNLGFAGATYANYGVWVRNASSHFTGSYLTLTSNLLGGMRVESDSTAFDTLLGIVADNNTGDGVYVGGPIVSLANSTSFNNTGNGFDFNNAGATLLTGNTAYGNGANGLYVANTTPSTTPSTTTIVGTPSYAAGQGNLFYNNTGDGINASGAVVIEGNTVYGQSANFDVGINLTGGASATENIAFANFDGIDSVGSSITYNTVFSNADVGIEGDGGTTITGNTAYGNYVGIKSISAPNSVTGPFITHNLVYNNTAPYPLFHAGAAPASEGIWLVGGNGATFYNNTVYQPVGDAIHIDADGGLTASNIQIENNILWTQNGYDIALSPTSENGFKSDFNDLYFTGSGAAGLWENIAQTTLAAWNTASSDDLDSISADPLFISAATGDFHEMSTTGSYQGGALSPVAGGDGLPVANPGVLTSYGSESPTIDRGDASFVYVLEPGYNGGFINLGAFGNTAQASQSPANYVLVLKSVNAQTLIELQVFTITWRSQDTSGTVKIDLLFNGSESLAIATSAPNSGSYGWTIPNSISPNGNYTIQVTRNTDSTFGASGAFNIVAPVTSYFVNNSPTGGIYTTAGGSDANSGLDAAHPKATIQALLGRLPPRRGRYPLRGSGHL